MNTTAYRYRFSPEVRLEDVEASLVLTFFATESIHGESQVYLDAGHYFDPDTRTCVIDASCPVGRDLNRIFVGFLRRELDSQAFNVEAIPTNAKHEQPIKEVA